MSELRRPYIKYGEEAFDRFAARFSLPVRKSDAIIFCGITCIKSEIVPAGFAVVYPETGGFQIFDLRTAEEKTPTDEEPKGTSTERLWATTDRRP